MIEYEKIWLSDKKRAPDGYYHADTVNKAKNCIIYNERHGIAVNEINVSKEEIGYSRTADGGTISNFLKWLKDTNRNYTIQYH